MHDKLLPAFRHRQKPRKLSNIFFKRHYFILLEKIDFGVRKIYSPLKFEKFFTLKTFGYFTMEKN